MARRKRKQKPEPVRPASREAQASGAASSPQNNINLEKPVPEPDSRSQPARKEISLATCVSGMFLTLVLGIYLGTLLPGIYQDALKGEIKEAPRQEAAPAAQESSKIDPDLARMIGDLEKKAAANPDSAPDWINLGNIYFDAFQPEKAIPAYEHALRLAPQNADVLTDLGIMYRETGQFAKALECFRKAVDINPRHENALYNEGVVLSVDLKKNDEARTVWGQLLDINPQAQAPNGKSLADMIRQLQ